MNFLAHIFLSGDNEDIKFGNFIGDFVKGNKYKNTYSEDIIKGIMLHREIDSFTDKHPIVKESILRLKPAYGRYAGVAADILYDHFLSLNWNTFTTEKLNDFVINFHYTVLERSDKLPRKARRFASPFIRKKRLLCYGNLSCFEEVLYKMSIFTSMPNKVKKAMKIINKDYELFNSEFTLFFPELINFSENFLSNQGMPQSNPKRQSN